jgi:hypothetical protein
MDRDSRSNHSPWHSGSYGAPDAPIHSVEHVWLHTLSDII